MHELCHLQLDPLYNNKEVDPQEIGISKNQFENLKYNEYCILSNGESNSAIAYKTIKDTIKIAKLPKTLSIKAKYAEHTAAIHAILYNNDVKIVILHGVAGGGKSYISLGCGLHATVVAKKPQYKKMLLIRNNVPASTYSLGLLPGELHEKMTPWFGPADDILEELLLLPSLKSCGLYAETSGQQQIPATRLLTNSGLLTISTSEYLRGASKKDTYVIVDDFQNFTKTETDLIMTRFGQGCKLVLCGDPSQVDNKQTNATNSGMELVQNMRRLDNNFEKATASIEFLHSECRGPIVKLYIAAKRKVTQHSTRH